MRARDRRFDVVWSALAEEQDGVVARRQLLRADLTPGTVKRAVASGPWQVLYPGVYAIPGPVVPRARVWAAVLAAGDGAVAGHRSALWLAGVVDDLPAVVDVVIPHERRALHRPGLRVHRMRDLSRYVHPAAEPPRMTLEAALLVTAGGLTTPEPVIDLVLRATQRRLTTASRLRTVLSDRPSFRWQALLLGVLAETDDGVASPLELRYARDVERAHGLPGGVRNARRGAFYLDVRYAGLGVVVELDGREAHPRSEAFRDLRRDNALVAAGDQVLRYGWRDVAGRPCDVATQVAGVLVAAGWTGRLHTCRNCPGVGKIRSA